MSVTKLKLAAHDCDQVRALFSGEVTIDGAEATFETAKVVTEIFKRMIVGREFDISELSFSYLLRLLETDDRPFVALPVFLARVFRHSAIYINKNSGIRAPRDLEGKRIGELASYSHDAGLWAKGILADEHGFDPAKSSWLIGGFDSAKEPIDYVPMPYPAGTEVTRASKDQDLGEMLDRGEIDALIAANVPKCVLDGSPNVGHLFPDWFEVEQDYHRRTGILPIMHLTVMKRDLAEQRPELVRAVYDAFVASKAAAMKAYTMARSSNHIDIMLPWFSAHFDRVRTQFPTDWWPYGIQANRSAIETTLRYHAEQGITRRLLSIEEVFAPDLLDT